MAEVKLTKAQWRLLEAGARVEPGQRRGAHADGRSWPAINKLRRMGWIQVDDVGHGGSGADSIWYRATDEGRASIARASAQGGEGQS